MNDGQGLLVRRIVFLSNADTIGLDDVPRHYPRPGKVQCRHTGRFFSAWGSWGESTRGATGVIGKQARLNYSMSIGHGEIIDDELGPPRIESPNVNEHAQLW